MLSEEEKKAIEDLNSFKSISILYGNTFTMVLDQLKKYQQATDIVLNLITKLQKENEELKKSINVVEKEKGQWIEENEVKDKQIKDLQYEEIYEYLEKISQDLDNVAIDQIPIAIAELKYKNQVTEKQIDLMAKYIDEIDVSEDICEGKTICDENCKDCIKQYFENKAKKGE